MVRLQENWINIILTTNYQRITQGQNRSLQIIGSGSWLLWINHIQDQGKEERQSLIYAFPWQPIQSAILGNSSDQTLMEFSEKSEMFHCKMRTPKKDLFRQRWTFVTAVKWLWEVLKYKSLDDFPALTSIFWQFNFSRAQWWMVNLNGWLQ